MHKYSVWSRLDYKKMVTATTKNLKMRDWQLGSSVSKCSPTQLLILPFMTNSYARQYTFVLFLKKIIIIFFFNIIVGSYIGDLWPFFPKEVLTFSYLAKIKQTYLLHPSQKCEQLKKIAILVEIQPKSTKSYILWTIQCTTWLTPYFNRKKHLLVFHINLLSKPKRNG